MISEAYMKRIGLTDDQIKLMSDEMEKESSYRRLLIKAGMSGNLAETIAKVTDLTDEDISDEALTLEKIKAEWADMIPKKNRNVQI